MRYDVAATADIIQTITTIANVRFKVTTCLYLSPGNKARSLSMLIAAIVNKDTENKTKPAMKTESAANDKDSIPCEPGTSNRQH